MPPRGLEPLHSGLKGRCPDLSGANGANWCGGSEDRTRTGRSPQWFSRPRPSPSVGWPLQGGRSGTRTLNTAFSRATSLPTTLLVWPDTFPASSELDLNQRIPPYQSGALTRLGHRRPKSRDGIPRRRGWDSNPRTAVRPFTPLAGVPDKPLWHLAVRTVPGTRTRTTQILNLVPPANWARTAWSGRRDSNPPFDRGMVVCSR